MADILFCKNHIRFLFCLHRICGDKLNRIQAVLRIFLLWFLFQPGFYLTSFNLWVDNFWHNSNRQERVKKSIKHWKCVIFKFLSCTYMFNKLWIKLTFFHIVLFQKFISIFSEFLELLNNFLCLKHFLQVLFLIFHAQHLQFDHLF